MNYKYFKQNRPFIVPTDDGKVIREHFGLASTEDNNLSFAHMTAPPGWSEPFQMPEFDELTFMIKGRKKIIINGETVILNAGESVHIKKGCRVQYSNPFDDEAEYVSVCIPAFSTELVNREE
jgi:ethanolamine utilization protein EutQ